MKGETASYMRGFLPYALAAFMVGIAGGFSTVLGPAFVQELDIGYQNTTWTALAQAISAAACAPVLGKLGDAIGRRWTLLLGIAVYTIGGILTSLAASLTGMLVARFIVGVGTAAIAPTVLAYIVTEFPKNEVAKGFSLYMLVSSTAVIVGPSLGGLMIRSCGWRGMIWVCVAVCVVVFVACLFLLDKRHDARKPVMGFDAAGAALVVVFFGLFLCIPSFGQNFGWMSSAFAGVLVAAVAALIALIFTERRAAVPILPGKFLLRKRFVIPVVAMFLTQGLMQANMTNIIVFVNETRPASSVISGYAISIMYLGMSLGAVLLGPLADRLEPKRVLIGSLTLTGLGCAVMRWFSADSPLFLLALSLGLLGFGLGGNGTIFMKVVLTELPAGQAGSGTGTYGLFRDISAPFGVAVFVPMFTNLITDLAETGTARAAAAVHAVRKLSVVEIACVAVSIFVVWLLPNTQKN